MNKHEFKWAPDLPFMEVRKFIAEHLRTENASPDLDLEVCRLLDVKPVPCTQNLMAAVSMIPEGWWFHMSHLEVKIIPTVDVPGAPISNSKIYDFYGKPIGFTAMCWERKDLPVAVCEALLKARYDLPAAFVVEASATAHNKTTIRMQTYRDRIRVSKKPNLFKRLKLALFPIDY